MKKNFKVALSIFGGLVVIFALLFVTGILSMSVFSDSHVVNRCSNSNAFSGDRFTPIFNVSVGVPVYDVSLDCRGNSRADGYCAIKVFYVDGSSWSSNFVTAQYNNVDSQHLSFVVPDSEVVSSIAV